MNCKSSLELMLNRFNLNHLFIFYSKYIRNNIPKKREIFIKHLYFSFFFTAPNIRYKITSGNVGNVFGIKDSTGEIFVARSLDYETLKKVCNLLCKIEKKGKDKKKFKERKKNEHYV